MTKTLFVLLTLSFTASSVLSNGVFGHQGGLMFSLKQHTGSGAPANTCTGTTTGCFKSGCTVCQGKSDCCTACEPNWYLQGTQCLYCNKYCASAADCKNNLGCTKCTKGYEVATRKNGQFTYQTCVVAGSGVIRIVLIVLAAVIIISIGIGCYFIICRGKDDDEDRAGSLEQDAGDYYAQKEVGNRDI